MYVRGEMVIRPYPVYGQADCIEMRPIHAHPTLRSTMDASRYVMIPPWCPITILEDRTDEWWEKSSPGHRLIKAVVPHHPKPFFILLSDA